jgi:hypothetical protein
MIRFNRRELNIALIAAGLCLDSNAQADDDTDTTGGGGVGGGDDSGEDDSGGDGPEPVDDSGLDSTGWIDNNDPLGLNCRAPGLAGDSMTMFQMLGTNTSVPPSYIGVEPGYYASDSMSDTFQTESQSFLDGAIQKLEEASSFIMTEVRAGLDNLVDSIFASAGTQDEPFLTVLVGHSAEGYVGETPVWGLVQTDLNGNNSETVGGGDLYGAFVTHSDGPDAGSWYGGVFIGAGVSLMVSAGIEKGDVVLDVGVMVQSTNEPNLPIDTIEVYHEFNITQPIRVTFFQIFGGLSDYRNFQDPLVSW